MFLQAILPALIFTLFSFSLANCQTTKLPKQPPQAFKITYHNGGGMTRAYTKIIIENSTLTFERLKGNQQIPSKWTAEISPADLEKIYGEFVENKFDLIKNDKREGIVYDAGSESISISFDKQFYRATYGANSPMSGVSLKHYQAVSKAILSLAGQYSEKRTK